MTAVMSDWAQAMFAVPFGLEQAANTESIQKCLCAGIVILTTARNHRVAVVCDARGDSSVEVPTGKHTRKLIHVRLRISRDRVALRIALLCAVGVEHVGANREELQYFAREILVRTGSRAQTHIEKLTHRRSECDLVEQRSVAAESVSIESLKIDVIQLGRLTSLFADTTRIWCSAKATRCRN